MVDMDDADDDKGGANVDTEGAVVDTVDADVDTDCANDDIAGENKDRDGAEGENGAVNWIVRGGETCLSAGDPGRRLGDGDARREEERD